MIWDADALNLLQPNWLPLPASHILTPHPGEAGRLLKRSAAAICAEPLAALELLQQKSGCHVVLKGAYTLISNGVSRAVNPCTAPALARGGSGDILTGVILALLGRSSAAAEEQTLTELQLAVLLHSQAGRCAAARVGEDYATPDEVIASLGQRSDF